MIRESLSDSLRSDTALASRGMSLDNLSRGARAFLRAALHEPLKIDGAVFACEMTVPLGNAFIPGESRILADLPACVDWGLSTAC